MKTIREQVMAATLGALCAGFVAPARAQEVPATPTQTSDAGTQQDMGTVLDELARIELMITVERDFDGATAVLAKLRDDWAGRTPTAFDNDEIAQRADHLRDLIAAAGTNDTASLREAVLHALDEHDSEALGLFDPRALALGLESVLLSDTSGLDGNAFDQLSWRLTMLMEVVPSHVLDAVEGHSDNGHPLDPRLVLRAMRLSNVIGEQWIRAPGRQPVCAEPRWLEVLAESMTEPSALADPGTPDIVAEVIESIVMSDAVTPELNAALARLLQTCDRCAGVRLLSRLDAGQVQVDSLRPLFETVMNHADPQVRVPAARALARYPANDVLRAHVSDHERLVRLQLLQTLEPRNVRHLTWPDRTATRADVERVMPVVDDGARQILTQLLADADPEVRESAVQVLNRGEILLDAEEYRRVAADPDPGVRAKLAELAIDDHALQVDVLKRLAADHETPVVAAVDQRLRGIDWNTASPEWISVLKARVANDTTHDQVDESGVVRKQSLLERALSGSACRIALTRESLRTGNLSMLRWVIGSAVREEQLSTDALRDWWALEPEEFRQLVEVLDREQSSLAQQLLAAPGSSMQLGVGDKFVDVCRQVFLDHGASSGVRLRAAPIALRQSTPELAEQVVAFLASDAMRAGVANSRDVQALRNLGAALPEADRNRIILAALTGGALDDDQGSILVDSRVPNGPDFEPLALEVLGRWGTAPVAEQRLFIVTDTLRKSGGFANKIDPGLLIGLSRDIRCADLAAACMAETRNPVFLPRLGEMLLDPRPPVTPETSVDAARQAIATYLNDEAAGLLIRKAGETSDAGMRERCLASVDAIRKYQDAVASWEQRTTSRATRDDAVHKLTGMLGDADDSVRAAALRSLGTLKAVEHLPEIVAALKDSSPDVRAAAQEALDRINAPPPSIPVDAAATQPQPVSPK